MVGAVYGYGVPRETEDRPSSMLSSMLSSIRFAYVAPPMIIWHVNDPLTLRIRSAMERGEEVEVCRTRSTRDRVWATAQEEVGVDFPEIAQTDGTGRARMKDIDIMWGEPFTWESEVIISKMDAREMKRILKDIGIIDDGTFSREIEDILYKMYVKKYKMYVPEMKSAYLRVNVMSNSTGDYNFYLDSGASLHVVFDPALLTNRRAPPSGTSRFRAADGSLLSVEAYGDIIMEHFRIPDVYLVQGLTVNLISVGQLASNHKVSSCFAGNECNLMLSGGKQIGGAIRRDDNQYILRFLEIE